MIVERGGWKGQRKRKRSKSATFLFLPLPTFWKGSAERQWANLRNMVLSLATPCPWKTVCQCCRHPSPSRAVCTGFPVYPGMTSLRQHTLWPCWPPESLAVLLPWQGWQLRSAAGLCSLPALGGWHQTTPLPSLCWLPGKKRVLWFQNWPLGKESLAQRDALRYPRPAVLEFWDGIHFKRVWVSLPWLAG